ncbi:hypothetical protein B296_00039644 [Ensete ventricosum]|uniref:Uncharacterized protein n=1 Tax=Ensete ventricosum TaxID=4639 RepID=A0A426XL48_ENSVE|nr:hypothetical protein B296_00039644 [Ensete ventricosum]
MGRSSRRREERRNGRENIGLQVGVMLPDVIDKMLLEERIFLSIEEEVGDRALSPARCDTLPFERANAVGSRGPRKEQRRGCVIVGVAAGKEALAVGSIGGGLGHIAVGPIAIFSTFPATTTFSLLTFFLYYCLLPTADLIVASDCGILAASPFCSSCPAFSVNLTRLYSSLTALCGNLLAALIAGHANSPRSFAALLPPSWQPHRSSVVARPKFPSVSTLELCKATCYPSFSV